MAGSVPGGGRPLILTEDPLLLDDLLRLCAAAGADPHVHHAVPEPGGTADTGGAAEPGGDAGSTGWESAPLVLVGDDAARRDAGRRAGPGYSSSAGTWTTPMCGNGRWRSAPRRC